MEIESYKLFGILKRPHGITKEELKSWWFEEHSQKVAKWPGLIKYAINLSITDNQEYDGLAEIWFENKAAMENVFNTDEGKIARESALSGSGKLILITSEEYIIVDKQVDLKS